MNAFRAMLGPRSEGGFAREDESGRMHHRRTRDNSGTYRPVARAHGTAAGRDYFLV